MNEFDPAIPSSARSSQASPQEFVETLRQTTTSRLKGRGRRWNPLNAEAVAAHTTLRDSGQWKNFWNIRNTMINNLQLP